MKWFRNRFREPIKCNTMIFTCKNCGRYIANPGMTMRDIKALPLCNCKNPDAEITYLHKIIEI